MGSAASSAWRAETPAILAWMAVAAFLGKTTGGWLADDTWTYVASSADGVRLAATARGPGAVYTSSDAGETWTEHEPGTAWQSVTSTLDGKELMAADGTGIIASSTDGGATWTRGELWPPNASSHAVLLATSSSGDIVAAAVYAGALYVSTDRGRTWTARGAGPSAFSMSARGDRMGQDRQRPDLHVARLRRNDRRPDRRRDLDVKLVYVGADTFVMEYGYGELFAF